MNRSPLSLSAAALVLAAGCGVSTLEMDGPSGATASQAFETGGEILIDDAGAGGGFAEGEYLDAGAGGGAGGGGGGEGEFLDAGTGGGAGQGGGTGAGGGTGGAGGGGEVICTPAQTSTCTTSCGSAGQKSCVGGTWGPCVPPPERCSNGLDDDCDGTVDGRDRDCPPVTVTCESSEGGSCNGDPGYGDHCAPQHNTGGCSAARFQAWCNRRNPATPTIWDDWIEGWVDARCDGAVTDDGQQYNTFSCLDSSNTRYQCTTPLVLQFEVGAPVAFAPGLASFAFTPGRPVHGDWPRAGTPWLVRDLDGDARISSGRELFGSDTRLASGRVARHGFEALAELDANRDGVVDARDPAFASLALWSDADGDRRTGPGELEPLRARGVVALSLRFSPEARCDARGNCERERAGFDFVGADGKLARGEVIDVYLAVQGAPVCRR